MTSCGLRLHRDKEFLSPVMQTLQKFVGSEECKDVIKIVYTPGNAKTWNKLSWEI